MGAPYPPRGMAEEFKEYGPVNGGAERIFPAPIT